MAGPNSAPNGDARLVRGYPGEANRWCDICKRVLPVRIDDEKHNRLYTGKTEQAKSRNS